MKTRTIMMLVAALVGGAAADLKALPLYYYDVCWGDYNSWWCAYAWTWRELEKMVFGGWW